MRVSLKKGLARKSPERPYRRMIAEALTLREIRKARKTSQKKLAAVLGVTQMGVSNFERRCNTRLDVDQNGKEAAVVNRLRERWRSRMS